MEATIYSDCSRWDYGNLPHLSQHHQVQLWLHVTWLLQSGPLVLLLGVISIFLVYHYYIVGVVFEFTEAKSRPFVCLLLDTRIRLPPYLPGLA